MDPRKVGNLIKDIRKNNNLTQKDLADKYGVTYQAVSKWENGTNLPDISLIKEICNDYNLDVNDFLDGNQKISKKSNVSAIVISVLSVLLILIIILTTIHIYNDNNKSDFEHKELNTTCDLFQVKGSIAYDSKKSSIFISSITYCGEKDDKVYDNITCNLYENDNSIYSCDKKDEIKLVDYLKELSIKVDDYIQKCNLYKEDTLNLKITAEKGGIKTVYEIPLKTDKC